MSSFASRESLFESNDRRLIYVTSDIRANIMAARPDTISRINRIRLQCQFSAVAVGHRAVFLLIYRARGGGGGIGGCLTLIPTTALAAVACGSVSVSPADQG